MTSPQQDYSTNRNKALKIAGVSAAALGGGAALALFVWIMLPVIAIILILVLLVGHSLFQPSEASLEKEVQASLNAVNYTTLPSYRHVDDEVTTQQGTCFIGCSDPTAYGSVDYTDERVALLARERLVKAGWHCTPLRSAPPARQRATTLFATQNADSSCTKWRKLSVGIFFFEPGMVELQIASGMHDDWTAISDSDYCNGASGGTSTADARFCASVSAEGKRFYDDYKATCAGWVPDESDDYCNDIAEDEARDAAGLAPDDFTEVPVN